MIISVAGTGYVGLVTAVCLAEKGHDVICVDIDSKKIDIMKKGVSPIYEQNLEELMRKNRNRMEFTVDYASAYRKSDVIFIGVGTPEQEDGSANLNYVRTVSKQIAENIEKDCVVVVKSTVPIGTNDEVENCIKLNLKNNVKFEVVSNPEFLAQGTAVRDTLEAKRIIIGTESERAKKIMMKIYNPFNLPMVFMSRKSAEMTKYAANDFLALKISYINDIANLCEIVGADIEEVVRGMAYDDRIGSKFLKAGIGYGGSCFPKDTKALYFYAKNRHGYETKTIKSAIDVNSSQKTKLFYLAKKHIGNFDGVNVTILGLTFKPGTDDLRESPSIDMVACLEKDGAIIHAYDPVGTSIAKKVFKDKQIQYCNNPIEACSKSEIIFLLTEWDEFIKIDKTIAFANKYVFDGRNCYSPKDMKMTKAYFSIGRAYQINKK